jgi:hypothetical protein
MAMMTFWSTLFFSLRVYIIYNYVIWLVQEKVLYHTVTLLLPMLYPVFAVQVAIQLIKNYIYYLAGFDPIIVPY